MIEITALEQAGTDAIEALLDRAFGSDRHSRTAYRLRAGTAAIPALSLAAHDGGVLIGTIQCWPVTFTADDGRAVPLTLLGPVAVEPARQRDGVGRLLMSACLDAAARAGLDGAIMLIGDPEYYGRFFGFSAERTAGWRLPGPVERHRLLARGERVPAADGTIGPRIAVSA
ncbi:GNAT family N-acetyltransferase [Sphingomonas sp. TX0543]|uniref:GNAT family N-acetyltransferase n=1 Tax=unclassified Sphingomonas TaxID=196159 RepID=UPI0010F60B74|nr:N-acetyltransferase [Sphingomonas sp. 3P27F8]